MASKGPDTVGICDHPATPRLAGQNNARTLDTVLQVDQPAKCTDGKRLRYVLIAYRKMQKIVRPPEQACSYPVYFA